MGLVENTLGIKKPKTNPVFQDEPGFFLGSGNLHLLCGILDAKGVNAGGDTFRMSKEVV